MPHTSDTNLPVDLDDAAFLAKLRAGDEDAATAFVRQCSPRVMAVARRMLGDDAEAADATQEAFIAAFRALPKFEGNSKLTTWLHRITVNAALMRLRKKRRADEVSLDALIPQYSTDDHVSSGGKSWSTTVDVSAEDSELRQHISEQIARLPPDFRDVLILRDIEGMNTRDASHALSITEALVKTRLHRARQALRALLLPVLEGDVA